MPMLRSERLAASTMLGCLAGLMAVAAKSIDSGVLPYAHIPEEAVPQTWRSENSAARASIQRNQPIEIDELFGALNHVVNKQYANRVLKTHIGSSVASPAPQDEFKIDHVLMVEKKAARLLEITGLHAFCIPTNESGCKDGTRFGTFQCRPEGEPLCPCRCPSILNIQNLLPIDYTIISNGGHLSTKRKPDRS